MIIINDCEQGSQEWLDLRLGKVTGSRMKDVLAKGRGSSPSKTRESYMFELITERLTGEQYSSFTNDAMVWGTETEPQARAMYEIKNDDVDVVEVAFIQLNDDCGISPDGLVGSGGMLEIKCPNTVTQLKRALKEKYYTDYNTQIQAQLWVAEREFCDFVSFDPRIDVSAGYLQQRVYRDEPFIKNMEDQVNIFIDEMKAIINKLNKG